MKRDMTILNRRQRAFTLIEPFDADFVGAQDKLPVARKGFTLIELLIVIAVIAMLVAIAVPSLVMAKSLAKRAVCSGNLRGMHIAMLFYLEDNDGQFFPYVEDTPDGDLWYWGLEVVGGPEGERVIDKDRARLARYFSYGDNVKICPSIRREVSYFKPKFDLAGYGYAINRCMLSDLFDGVKFEQITRPTDTAVWADSMQINIWQAPASPSNPMLEEWYFLDNRGPAPATFHFRHRRECNAAFADGSVRDLQPYWLDSRCDGLVGRPELPVAPTEVSPILKLDK